MRADYQLLKDRESKVAEKARDLEDRELKLQERQERLREREAMVLGLELKLVKLKKNQSDDVKKQTRLEIGGGASGSVGERRLSCNAGQSKEYPTFGSLIKKIRITMEDIPRSSQVLVDAETGKRDVNQASVHTSNDVRESMSNFSDVMKNQRNENS